MVTKTYQVGFYQGVYGDKDTKEKISTYLTLWAKDDSAPVINIGDYTYRIKQMTDHSGKMLRGIFAKFRHDDLPKIGSSGDNSEKDIALSDEEGLIEKNHFVFDKSKQLVVYQQNGHGSTINKFAEYFTYAGGETTVFNPVLQPEAMKRLLQAGNKPKKMHISVAYPSNPELLAGNKFNKNLMKLMTDSGSLNLNIVMSMGHAKKEYLSMDISKAMTELFDHAVVSIARFDVEDPDGVTHPIDLIADRLKGSIIVKMDGRYPDTSEVFQELSKLKIENNEQIAKILGK